MKVQFFFLKKKIILPCVCVSSSIVPDSLWPHGLLLTRLCPRAHEAPLSQAIILEWVAISSPGDLPDPEMEPTSLVSPEMAGRFLTTSITWEAQFSLKYPIKSTEIFLANKEIF